MPHDLAPAGGGVPELPAAESRYWAFYDRVARAQVLEWLPSPPGLLVDLSACPAELAGELVARGHCLVQVHPAPPQRPPVPGAMALVADPHWLDWATDESVDAVLAERRVLSTCLATELTLDQVARVLRPGGRLFVVVDSLVQGLSQLAQEGRWAELADVPAADVVLVPTPQGEIRRCFWPEELRAALSCAGLVVDSLRARTLLSPEAVEHALDDEPRALGRLVATELQLESAREAEWGGFHLVAAAHKPERTA